MLYSQFKIFFTTESTEKKPAGHLLFFSVFSVVNAF